MGSGQLADGINGRGETTTNAQTSCGLAERIDLVDALLAGALVAEAGCQVKDPLLLVDVESDGYSCDVVVAEAYFVFGNKSREAPF